MGKISKTVQYPLLTPGCTNRQLQDLAKNPQSGVALEVFDTGGGKGWGVRALRDLQAGELITEYVGRVLDNRQLATKIKGKIPANAT